MGKYGKMAGVLNKCQVALYQAEINLKHMDYGRLIRLAVEVDEMRSNLNKVLNSELPDGSHIKTMAFDLKQKSEWVMEDISIMTQTEHWNICKKQLGL